MEAPYIHSSKQIERRAFLRGAGVFLSLPWLEAMTPAFAKPSNAAPPRRFVSVSLALGLHAPNLNPTESGRNYTPSPYLTPIKDLLSDLTIVSGSSHPGVTGGHNAEGSILSAAPYSRNGVFRNTISLDQYLAKHQGHETRLRSLVLNTSSNTSPSYTETGSMIPAEDSPSKVFNRLFVADTPEAQAEQLRRVKQGRSIMDIIGADAKRLQKELGAGDRDKLDEYVTSVRNFEERLSESEDWARKEKPRVKMAPPVDIRNNNEVIARKKLMLDVLYLALQTDSTRFATLHLNGNGGRIPIEGVDEGYHSLSHHGRDENKIEQLTLVEKELVSTWGGFVRKLKESSEGSDTLLDRTTVLLTSNLGNASAHNNKNMPVLLAGGGFRHGQHLAFDQKNNYPLPNLYLSILRRQGLEADKFATSTGEMAGLETV